MKLIMDTNLKNAIAAMHRDIAAMEKEQRNNKEQRKTVRFTGERIKPVWKAICDAQDLGDDLRLHYAAYGLLRCKNFDVTENQSKPVSSYIWKGLTAKRVDGLHPLCLRLEEVDKILGKYGYGLKNYEEEKTYLGTTIKYYDVEDYEEVVYISE